jgi:hypothetical protein
LNIEDRAKSGGFHLSQEEMYSLVLWPWMEPMFAGPPRDMSKILKDAFVTAQMRATIPRILRANVIQILIIVRTMIRALRTGRMRWSLKRSAHFEQASRLFFLIEKGRPPKQGESFESLFRQTRISV